MGDWIAIVNGVMPKEIADCGPREWEFIRKDGERVMAIGLPCCSEDWWKTIDKVRDLRPKPEGREYNHVPPKNVRTVAVKYETGQRRLTREAYERYKAKQPVSNPSQPMHQHGIENAILSALTEVLKK